MGQVKNNDSFLGKAEKLKPVLKHRMLRPVGVVSFERKKADSGADEMICSGTRPIQELLHQVLGKGQKLVLDSGGISPYRCDAAEDIPAETLCFPLSAGGGHRHFQ